jgi:hypothetical protein
MNDRNNALVFAKSTRDNLRFIEDAERAEHDVHRVIQITLSLLGIVVIPTEKLLLPHTKHMTMLKMAHEGWPTWKITLDTGERKTRTLADLLRHLRNAVAHGRLKFTSGCPDPAKVYITAEDKLSKSSPINWRARIRADQLRTFCLKFLDFIDDSVG